jgi:hypothetical protein
MNELAIPPVARSWERIDNWLAGIVRGAQRVVDVGLALGSDVVVGGSVLLVGSVRRPLVHRRFRYRAVR